MTPTSTPDRWPIAAVTRAGQRVGGDHRRADGLTYTPNANYCNTQTGGTPDTFTYTLTPGGVDGDGVGDGDLCPR